MWDGHSEPKDREEMREAASFLLAENELDRTWRADGGLYAYLDDQQQVIIRAANNHTMWAFTSWAAVKQYVECVHALAEQGVRDAACLDVDRFEALLRAEGQALHATETK